MPIKKKNIRKELTKQIHSLHDIVADIDTLLTKMEVDFYRVCIFGSARIETGSEFYNLVENLAEALAKKGVDIVTGGGPGLMEAANKGAKSAGDIARSIGLPIDLPFENDANNHLDVKSQHKRFSTRLDEFMRLSHAVIVTPGGIGTLLELFYTWQLIQVNHIKPRPLILLGHKEMWTSFMQWMSDWPLKLKLINKSDIDNMVIVSTVDEVMDILNPDIEKFRKEHT